MMIIDSIGTKFDKHDKQIKLLKKENKELKRRLDFCYEQIESLAKLMTDSTGSE